MTQTLATTPTDSSHNALIPAPFTPTRQDWKYCGILLGILLCLYVLLQNGLWASGPDTAYYISVARDVALGRGLTFNGEPVGRAPPLWPLVLAGAMKISPTFRFLNLLPMACILASIGMWFFVLRRLTTPRRAFWIALLSGTLFHWYTATNQLRTEGLFCLIFTAALLVASQIAEGRAQGWRIALLLLLCIGIVSTRYAGLAASFVVGAVVLSGQRRPGTRQRIAFVGSIAITLASFIAIRYALRYILPHIHDTALAGAPTDDSGEVVMTSVLGQGGPLTYLVQGLKAGQWVSSLLWMPLHIAVSNKWLALAVNLLGWLLLATYTVCLIRHIRQRRWILIGVAAYSASIIFRWTVVNPRYLMPVAPFLLLGIWLGMEHLKLTLRRPWASKLFAAGVPILLVTLLLCNLTLLGIDVAIARSSNFYHYYLAGEVEELIGAARYLQGLGVKNGEVAVNAQYINLNRTRSNGFSMRGLVMLLDRRVAIIPNKSRDATKSPARTRRSRQAANPSTKKTKPDLTAQIGDGPPNRFLLTYAAEQKPPIRYYVYRPPISPWRAWHFRVPWLQRFATRQTDIPDNPGWELYEFDETQFTRIPIPDARNWLVRVPGMYRNSAQNRQFDTPCPVPIFHSAFRMKNTLSIDFEDWFQPFAARSIAGWDRFPSRVPQDTDRLLSLLSRYNVRCTFFILGEVAEKFPDCIRAIHQAGHEIGSHGYRHVPLFKQDPAQFEQEMRASLDFLQRLTGEPVLGFRAPFFSVREESLWALDSLKRLGLQYDTSVNPIARAFHGYTKGGDLPFTHDNGLREFPITTYRLAGVRIPFGGGMYYRLLPYPVIHQGLKRLNARGTAANVYFHPREFDPDLPRLKTGLKTALAMKLIVYAGTASLEEKLARLLQEFTFVPMRELL